MTYVFKLAVLGIAIGCGAVAGMAEAREAERPGFEALDADGDGTLTKAEMEAHRAARFASADINGDSLLSLEELQARGQERAAARAARMLERLDANSDGQLSEDELAKAGRGNPDRMFQRADSNGDGVLSKAEFEDARAQHARPSKN